jgi:hypothetical protein
MDICPSNPDNDCLNNLRSQAATPIDNLPG